MSSLKPLPIDIVSDVVCPWCYIGKRRIENALALVPDVPVEVQWRPFFLNPWVPREGISRDEYLTTKFGSVEAYKGMAGRVVAAAGEEGLSYRPDLVKRQPNTIDCHRLIHWAEAKGKSAEMKQRLMELYFRDGGDLTDIDVLVQAAADCGLDADDVRRRLATDEDVERISAQAQEAAEAAIKKIKGGAKFEDVAKAESTDSSKANGGDLGWFTLTRMAKPFGDAVKGLKKGEMTATPVQTQFGWHVIKLEDTRETAPPPFEQVKQQVSTGVMQKKLQAYVETLKKTAKIEKSL